MVMVDWALRYAAQGLRVFPIHYPVGGVCSCGDRGCKSVGKHPVGKWQEDASGDPVRIEWMWGSGDFNIGVECVSFCVLDIDPKHGGDVSLAELMARFGELPAGLRVRTGGGGEHIFFQPIDGAINNNNGKIGVGIDFKTKGGYVVLPPSLHVSGRRYEWIIGERGSEIAEAPDWLRKRVVAGNGNGAGRLGARGSGYWRGMAGGLAEGDRHNAIISVAGLLINDKKIDLRLAVMLVRGFNLVACRPPKSDAEVDACIRYVLLKRKLKSSH